MVIRKIAISGGMNFGPAFTRQRQNDGGTSSSTPLCQESVRALAGTTVQKWKKRGFVSDARMGPKEVRSTVLSVEQEAACVAFRRHTLLPLDDCLYALQPSIPTLTRSSLHRLFQRHGINRLADVGDTPARSKVKPYAIGYIHIDIAEVRTEEGKLHLFVVPGRRLRRPTRPNVQARLCPA